MTHEPATPATDRKPAPAARGFQRPLLWVLLALALAANAITSVLSVPTAVSASFGVLALALGALLVRDYYRRRAATRAGHPGA